MKHILLLIGQLISFIYPKKLREYILKTKLYVFTGYKSRSFKVLGRNSTLGIYSTYIGEEYISIGNCSHIGNYGRLTAYDYYFFTKQTFNPKIIIGDNCSIGEQSHITAINSISIGNNVLTGPRVLITDNAHGASVDNNIDIAPISRKLTSNGAVVIEDNVWIGEGAMIMPNVKVGEGSIIAANSVVTKDIPPYCVAAGSPARIIKKIR